MKILTFLFCFLLLGSAQQARAGFGFSALYGYGTDFSLYSPQGDSMAEFHPNLGTQISFWFDTGSEFKGGYIFLADSLDTTSQEESCGMVKCSYHAAPYRYQSTSYALGIRFPITAKKIGPQVREERNGMGFEPKAKLSYSELAPI